MKRYISSAIKSINDEDFNFQYDLAKHTNRPTVLSELAESQHASVRETVVRNPSTPPKTLAQLAKDRTPSVRKAFSDAPHAPADIRDAALTTLKDWSGEVTYVFIIGDFDPNKSQNAQIQKVVSSIKDFMNHRLEGEGPVVVNVYTEDPDFNDDGWYNYPFEITCKGLYDELSINVIAYDLENFLHKEGYLTHHRSWERYLK